MHKHYIYRSNELVAALSGDSLVDMINSIKEFIADDISAQNTFSDIPTVTISKLSEGDEAVFVGSAGEENYIYIVKSTWQS